MGCPVVLCSVHSEFQLPRIWGMGMWQSPSMVVTGLIGLWLACPFWSYCFCRRWIVLPPQLSDSCGDPFSHTGIPGKDPPLLSSGLISFTATYSKRCGVLNSTSGKGGCCCLVMWGSSLKSSFNLGCMAKPDKEDLGRCFMPLAECCSEFWPFWQSFSH